VATKQSSVFLFEEARPLAHGFWIASSLTLLAMTSRAAFVSQGMMQAAHSARHALLRHCEWQRSNPASFFLKKRGLWRMPSRLLRRFAPRNDEDDGGLSWALST
jgi:hypothetical protein